MTDILCSACLQLGEGVDKVTEDVAQLSIGRFGCATYGSDLHWFAFQDRRGVRPTFYMKAYWDLTAAMVARNVANRLGMEVDIVTEVDGRPVVVAKNTMVCRPLHNRRTNHRRTNTYEYVVRRFGTE